MSQIVQAEVSEQPLSPDYYCNLVKDNSAGAIVLFSGDVRDHDGGKKVTSLTYEAHPDAQAVLLNVATEISKKHELIKVALGHRYGPIAIGECAFVVAVSAAHRHQAFVACQEIVDEVKAKIPIWKHQVFVDGTDEWVNFA